jgi:hypothetical protein
MTSCNAIIKDTNMRKLLISILLIPIAASVFGQFGQDNYILYFDTALEMQHLKINVSSHSKNIWQVGPPQKTVFKSAYSLPNVIVTDTINPYPINDTSVFTIINVASGHGFETPHTVTLEGQYYVNSDTLTDYGKIEFSPDKGGKWIDLLRDTILMDTLSPWYWYWDEFGFDKPTLTGNSNGWKYFYINLAVLGHFFGVHDGDTILYRFSFISDSIQTNKDGLMFDNLNFVDYSEGIEKFQNNNLVSIFPNPVSEQLGIHIFNREKVSVIQIIDMKGQIIYNNQNFQGETIETKQYRNGVYILKYSNANSFSIKKFIVLHQNQ